VGQESIINNTILDGREISLKETLSCFESFYKASGLKMNASKTKAV
jgi:hypothetical protein